MNFLRVLAVCGRTRNFLRLLANRIWNFLRLELLADKAQFNFFSPLACSCGARTSCTTSWRALFLGCTVSASELHTVLTSSIFLICCNLLFHLSARKAPVHTRPHPCSWLCPPDRLTVHPLILLSLVDRVFVN